MIHLDIDSEEKEDLMEFLQSCLDSLDVEVAHTDHRAFRDMLKQKEGVLQRVLEKPEQDEDH
jgi:hypothetical protein